MCHLAPARIFAFANIHFKALCFFLSSLLFCWLIIGPVLLFAADYVLPPSLPPPSPPLPSSEQGLSFMSVGRPNIGQHRLGQQRTCLYFIVLLSSLYYTCYSLLTQAHIFVPPTKKKNSPRLKYFSSPLADGHS